MDGFSGHFHMDISNYCRENNIVLLVLLENATHLGMGSIKTEENFPLGGGTNLDYVSNFHPCVSKVSPSSFF